MVRSRNGGKYIYLRQSGSDPKLCDGMALLVNLIGQIDKFAVNN